VKQTNGLFVNTFNASPTHLPILITTVSDNEAQHSKRDVIKAREAWNFQQRLANPPDHRLTKALSHGCIIAPHILPADVSCADTIYGPNPRALQGRTTTTGATAFHTPLIPRVQDDQRLYTDLFFVANIPFLLTISKPLEHLMSTPLDGKDTASLRKVQRRYLDFYGQRLINITHLCRDKLFQDTPYTVHRTPDTGHLTPDTVHRTPYTIHRTPYTVHRTPFGDLPLLNSTQFLTSNE
jgi:hypothetical protein